MSKLFRRTHYNQPPHKSCVSSVQSIFSIFTTSVLRKLIFHVVMKHLMILSFTSVNLILYVTETKDVNFLLLYTKDISNFMSFSNQSFPFLERFPLLRLISTLTYRTSRTQCPRRPFVTL